VIVVMQGLNKESEDLFSFVSCEVARTQSTQCRRGTKEKNWMKLVRQVVVMATQ
jgi:hypothetical protein